MRYILFSPTLIICIIINASFAPIIHADQKLVPAITSGFYYQMGGGQDIPLPAFYDTATLPLNAGSEVGLGFNCNAFNPRVSMRNSLNGIKSSGLNVARQVLSDATAAVTEFPLYELSRADPNLYNLITNAMAGAKQDITASTKSCEVMQSEIAAGQDPYAHWGQIALGHRWQQAIGTATLTGKGDVQQARYQVAHDGGKRGVPWVNPDNRSSGQTGHAGGQHQPPIHVIRDTVRAGYQMIVENNRKYAEEQAASALQRLFPRAKLAANWVVDVVGDEIITTYNQGLKRALPGTGLNTVVAQQTKQLLPKLAALVSGRSPLTLKALQALSPQGLALSPSIFQSMQHQPPILRRIMVNKLAQNIAALKVLNQARLAQRILQVGAHIPVIYSNPAAQKTIQAAIGQLQQDVSEMLRFIQARQKLMTHLLTTILQAGQAQTAQNTGMALPKAKTPALQRGAVRVAHEDKNIS